MRLALVDADGDRIKGGDELWPSLVRRLSIPIARRLLRLGMRPEPLVLLSLLLALTAGVALARDRPIRGGVLFFLAWLVDFVDGDLARKGGKVSALGAFFDSVCGKLMSASIYTGATYGLWHRSGDYQVWVLGFLVMTGHFLFTSIKAKAGALDPEARDRPAGLRHRGDHLEKPAWRLAAGLLLAGNDTLLLFCGFAALLGRQDWLLLGSAVYSWAYAGFVFVHGARRLRQL